MNNNKDLNYWKENAEENYITTPISVLKYITELENSIKKTKSESEKEHSQTIIIDKITKTEKSIATKIGITLVTLITFGITLYPSFDILRSLVGSIIIGWWTGTFLAKLWLRKYDSN
jgi:hypothetical protein